MPAADRRPPRVPEKAVQADCVTLLRWFGFHVIVLGTVRPQGDHPGTRQSPGAPDLIAIGHGRCLMVEVKARGGRLRPAQMVFRQRCLEADVSHVVGGVDDLIAWLQAEGVRRPLALSTLAAAADVPEEGEAD